MNGIPVENAAAKKSTNQPKVHPVTSFNPAATLEGDQLVIRIPYNRTPELSASGKSFLIASTPGGFVSTSLTVDGLPVQLSLNAIIKNTGYVKPKKAAARK